jgi:hypothetical protein
MAVRIGKYGATEDIGPSDPGSSLVLVTPSDTEALPGGVARSLWISVAGDITVLCENDTDPVTMTVPYGLFPFRVKAVHASGTTATVYAIY